MGEVQDDDQWLYGDEKENERKESAALAQNQQKKEKSEPPVPPQGEKVATNADVDAGEKEKTTEGVDKDGDDSSSDEDGPTVTIGKLVKQPDVMRPPPSAHRAAPAASGLKDDDFTGPGKVNNTLVPDLNISDYEDKPWRKPGSDLSDYFNYGFREETWTKYCDRQKNMRNESGAGMSGLGMGKMMMTTPSAMPSYNRPQRSYDKYYSERNGDDRNYSRGASNTIEVMTADRRVYPIKQPFHNIQSSHNRDYAQQSASYGPVYYPNMVQQPHPPVDNVPPPQYATDYNSQPPMAPAPHWNMPPPGFPPSSDIPHDIIPTISGGGPVPTLSQVPIFEGDLSGVRVKEEPGPDRSRSPDRTARRRSSSKTRSRRSRSTSRTRRSRSTSRGRRRKSYSRSRSRSPSSRHRKKRSKREREED